MGTKSTRLKKEEKKIAFLRAYAQCGSIRKSAKAVDIDRRTYYKWRDEDPEWAEALKVADDEYNEIMEEEADRRAIEGVKKPIYYKGERIDLVQEYSDTLLMFRMKGRMPEKYRDNQVVEHKGHVTINHLLQEIDGKGLPKPRS